MQRRAAEHHGDEDRQQHRRSDQRIGGARLGGEKHPGKAVGPAGDDISGELDPRAVDAIGARRLLVAADCVERHAEARAAQQRP